MWATIVAQEDPVLARLHQQLHEPRIGAFGHRAVEMLEVIADDFKWNAALARHRFGQADVGRLRIGVGDPRHGRIVGAELANTAEQGVDRGVPGLVGGEMRELQRARDVSDREDVGKVRLEMIVDGDRLARLDPKAPRARSRSAAPSADRDDDLVEGDPHLLFAGARDQDLAFATNRLMSGADVDPFGTQRGLEQSRHLFVVVRKDARARST